MWNAITVFVRMSWRRKRLLWEAFVNTFTAWIMVRLLPYRIWKRWLGHPVSLDVIPLEIVVPGPADGIMLADIAWAHKRLGQVSKGVFTCLMLGFSARAMLRRRGIESILVLGAGRNGDGGNRQLGAHAWVIHKTFDIAGGGERNEYSPVAAFGPKRTTTANSTKSLNYEA
ncbi:MAG: lasso peptide biosynthesis B2 protein [Pseudomonadota bacterium]